MFCHEFRRGLCGSLLSEALGVQHNPAANPRLFVLRLKWKQALSRGAGHDNAGTLGITVVGHDSLRTLRIQDCLRKLGLGAELMERLLRAGAPPAL